MNLQLHEPGRVRPYKDNHNQKTHQVNFSKRYNLTAENTEVQTAEISEIPEKEILGGLCDLCGYIFRRLNGK